jgi:hypothetical protein
MSRDPVTLTLTPNHPLQFCSYLHPDIFAVNAIAKASHAGRALDGML